MIKPGALQRRILGEVLKRFEIKGLKIIAMKMIRMDRDKVREHYAEHIGKDFYELLESYMITGPVIALVMAGPRAIRLVRTMCGPTLAYDAPAGTIRGDFAPGRRNPVNVIHASDSPESAETEIARFFDEGEIHDWEDPFWDWF